MMLVGVIELSCVGLLLFGRSRPGVLATWALLVLMAGAVYTHFSIGDRLPEMAPALAALAFVLTRLYAMGALDDAQIKIKI